MIDPKCTVELGQKLGSGCKVVLLEKKGHLVPFEAEDEVNSELEIVWEKAEERFGGSNGLDLAF